MIIKDWLNKLRGIKYVRSTLAAQESLSDDFRRRILKTYMDTVIFDRIDEAGKKLNLVGYDLNFCESGHYQFLFEELFINQEYAFNDVGPTPYIVDCGSNIGMSVIFFKHVHPDAKIVAFEPDDAAFDCLQKNVAANNFQDVSIHKKALSKDGGQLEFYLDSDGEGSLTNSSFGSNGSNKIVVDSVKLSEYLDREVDILKMDIEGGENEVIEELSEQGVLKNVKQMSIEYHHHVYNDKDVLAGLLSILEKEGFGYQIEGKLKRPFKRNFPQGMILYAYRKDA